MGNSAYNNTSTGYGASNGSGESNFYVSNGYCSVKVTSSSQPQKELSFKVGGIYPNITCRTKQGTNYIKNGLGTINIQPYIDGEVFQNNFNIVGQPMIVEGIVNGLSSVNYLTLVDSFDGYGLSSWEIVFSIFLNGNTVTPQALLGRSGSSNCEPFIGLTEGNVMTMKLANENNYFVELQGQTQLPIGTWCWVKYEFTGSVYKLSYSTDGIAFVEDASFNSTEIYSIRPLTYIGYSQNVRSNEKYPFFNTIDLNKSYIKKDNAIWWTCLEESPHGEYTVYVPKEGGAYLLRGGIYRQPKIPSRYEVKKYATIDRDYWASDFSPSGGVILDNAVSTLNKPWEIETKIRTGSDVNTPQMLLGPSRQDITNSYPFPRVLVNNGHYHFNASSNNSSWNIVNNTGTHTISSNSIERVKYGWTGSQYYVKYANEEWRTITNPTRYDVSSVACSKNIAVALRTIVDDNYMYSTNGTTWNSGRFPSSFNWNKVKYVGDIFLVFSSNLSDTLLYSTNGINWIQQISLPTLGNWKDVAYGNGLYVMIQTNSNNIIYSEDGLAWNTIQLKEITTTTDGLGNTIETSIPLEGNYNWETICFGNDMFILSCSDSSTYFTSYDGLNWTKRALPDISSVAGSGYKITSNGSMFVGYEYNASSTLTDRIIYSEDGINWNYTSGPEQKNVSLNYLGGRFISLSYTGSSYISLTSRDGIKWEQRSLPAGTTWADLIYVNSTYFAIPTSAGYVAIAEPDKWYNDVLVDSTTVALGSTIPLIIGNCLFMDGATEIQRPFLGKISLPDTTFTFDGEIVWEYLPKEFVWENTAYFPTTIQRFHNGQIEEFNDIPLGRLTIDSEGIHNIETFQFNNKYVTKPNSTRPSEVVRSYKNKGGSWMNIYADRWCEQGGSTYIQTGLVNIPITLVTKFKDTNYCVELTAGMGGTPFVVSKTEDTITVQCSQATRISWYACGMLP